MIKPSVPLQLIVNLYHFDCRSPPDPQQEFVGEISCVPNPALEEAWLNGAFVHNMDAVGQSCPAEGGGLDVVMQVVKVPCVPEVEIV
jgi:hypothetical protein